MSPPGVASHPLLSIATPSRDNIPYTTTKGLLNEPGQNNCFLNSAVQVLWHLDIFRRSFRDLMGHACMAESCIFCALKELFSQLQYSQESALPPDALRKALAESFSDQQRFQLGFMDDAAECFENILLRIHTHIAHGESQDMCNASHCIPHQKFAMTLVEQTVCGSCGATSEPLTYTQMVHYVSTSTLVYQVRNTGVRTSPFSPTSFGQLLRKAGNMGDVRMCPSHCGAVIQISRTLMNWPEIVSIGLVWNSERPSLEHIMEVFSTIGTTMLLGDVFTSVMEKKWTENCTHNLVGVVTYYGKHYSTFFFHTKLRVWIYFDDATVRQVGPHWEQVVEKCRKGRYQPLLLLYATPDGTPVNTENAPKQVTQLCPQKNVPISKTNQGTLLRRSITPSPEKPNIGNTRRAITPSPECSILQKPPLPRSYNDYQNLSVIQNSLHKSPEITGYRSNVYKKLEMDAFNKPPVSIHRTSSNGSSSGIEMSDHNFPRRRDSGNWSGDRNSASSASSTTMENPYLYLVGKVPQTNVPESPTLVKSDSSSAGSAIYDAGYDSYSLSSNDSSSMIPLQHLMKIGHLAKIPEDYNNTPNQITQSCDVLCDEADELLVKSRQLEDEHDLVLALALCNAAATKARAAMNAPYNNPQTLTLARMKHNTCIMRARSLHRRMTQTTPNLESAPPEIRHTREGSSGSGRHSRQNSRDKGQHSRQNSKELLNIPQLDKPPHKNIEIYATLPKRNKEFFKNKIENISIEEPVTTIEKQPLKESRSFFSRSKQKDTKVREKRSRSEDRSKRVVEFTLTPEIIDIKPKVEEKPEKEKDVKSKKQHKIRRKLLMGGLIKRKNRSMPDLTDANPEMESSPQFNASVDDSKVGVKANDEKNKNMSGYLSEGHLEFNNANQNLKKSKLMKKSFYASAGRILSVPKVPPPPPLRTTSQLSISKPLIKDDDILECVEYKNPMEMINSTKYDTSIIEKLKLDQSRMMTASNNNFNNENRIESNTFITLADVHRNQNSSQNVDEVDCFFTKSTSNLDLPPYPSPAGSTLHSRQASEEFPPPPSPLDLSPLDEHLPQPPPVSNVQKDEKLSTNANNTLSTDGDVWLKELQAKQAALKIKRMNSFSGVDDNGLDVVNTQKYQNDNFKSLVKDLTSKFENKTVEERIMPVKKTVTPEIVAEEIKEVEEINATLQETLNKNNQQNTDEIKKNKLGKKKSVSFCDQVILVATAEDQKDDEYIPNPILERVLRSAINKSENAQAQDNEPKKEEALSANLFDITMRNTMENSKVINPNVVAKVPEIQKVPIQNHQSVYSSVAFAHNKNSPNSQNAQQINVMNQQVQYSQNQYNYGVHQGNQMPYVAQHSPKLSQQQIIQPMGGTPPQQYPYNLQQNGNNNHHPGYGYTASPPYQQDNLPQQQQQRYYHTVPHGSPIYNEHQPNQQYSHPNFHHQNIPPQSIYSTSPQQQQQQQYSIQKAYGNEGNHRQIHPEYQPRPNYQHAPFTPKTHNILSRNGIYQSVPFPVRNPNHHKMGMEPSNNPYQRVPIRSNLELDQQKLYDIYHKVPVPQHEKIIDNNYHQVPNINNNNDISIDKAVVTPIIVNNANNSIPDRTKCNLCRKKIVASSNLYCADCEYYMSRFKPKT